jgi:hypothetical protein
MNRLVFPDTLEIRVGLTQIASVRPGSLFYNNQYFQPQVNHWFKISPTEEQKLAYYHCQEAISIYSDRCMAVLPKQTIITTDLKHWLDTARKILESELPIGNPYSTKASATLSVYHFYSKPPERREIEKILTHLRLAMLYCHLAIFSSAGPDTLYYLKPTRHST